MLILPDLLFIHALASQAAPAVIVGRTDITRDPYSTIIARNMPFRATEADIVHFFGQAGKVSACTKPLDIYNTPWMVA